MTAEWKIKGLYKADAQKVADEIGESSVTPQEVLEKARNENSELHKCFEWDDSIAAEKYRLRQAREIIVNLVYAPKKKEEQPVRCFQITTEKSVYKPTKQFLVQEDEYQKLLARANAELESFKRRYATLSELESVFEAIEHL
nr:MAG TPA: hypothetical protein [Caudoviricetes sp.]